MNRLTVSALLALSLNAFAKETTPAQRLFEKLKPSVFQIRTAISPSSPKASYGSGFVVDRNGIIATNYHVINDSILNPNKYHIYVHVEQDVIQATVVSIDVVNDLALLSVPKTFSTGIPLATKMPKSGGKIFSIGIPQDLNLSITEGNYNGILKYGPYETIHMANALNPGMSGGPTVNTDGELIGVNASVFLFSQEISFSVPAKTLQLLLEKNKKPLGSSLAFKEIRTQLLALQDELLSDMESSGGDELEFFNFRVPRPSKILKCWSENLDPPHGRYRKLNQTCYLPHSAVYKSDLPIGNYDLLYEAYSSSKINSLKLLALARDSYNSEEPRETKNEHLTAYECFQQDVVNRNGIRIMLNACIQGYEKIPDLYQIALKQITLTGTGEILVMKANLRGFDSSAIKSFVQKFVHSPRKEGYVKSSDLE